MWGRPSRERWRPGPGRGRDGGRRKTSDVKVGSSGAGGEAVGVWREERWRRGKSGSGEVREGRSDLGPGSSSPRRPRQPRRPPPWPLSPPPLPPGADAAAAAARPGTGAGCAGEGGRAGRGGGAWPGHLTPPPPPPGSRSAAAAPGCPEAERAGDRRRPARRVRAARSRLRGGTPRLRVPASRLAR